jgi:hypothetical protein
VAFEGGQEGVGQDQTVRRLPAQQRLDRHHRPRPVEDRLVHQAELTPVEAPHHVVGTRCVLAGHACGDGAGGQELALDPSHLAEQAAGGGRRQGATRHRTGAEPEFGSEFGGHGRHHGDGVGPSGGMTGNHQDQFLGVETGHLAATGQAAPDLLAEEPQRRVRRRADAGPTGEGSVHEHHRAPDGGVTATPFEPVLEALPGPEAGQGVGGPGVREVP